MGNLSKGLREARLKKGYTQEQVGKLLGMTRLSLWGMENGKRMVGAEELFRLAQLYGRPLEDFFTEEFNEDDVLYSLRKYGYPVLSSFSEKPARLLDPSSVVLYVLKQFPDPRLVEGLPVVFLNQGMNYDWLYLESVRQGLQNRLGLVVDLASHAFRTAGVTKGLKELEDLLVRLERVKLYREETFQGELPNKNSAVLLSEMSDPLSKKWNLLTNFPLDSVTRWVLRAKKNQPSAKA